MREVHPESIAVPPRAYGMHHRLVDHPREGPVFDAGVGEEVLVLGGQDGVAEDRRHLIVGDDSAILSCHLDQHPILGVVDAAGRRELETDEGLEIGNTAPVEVDVVNEPHGQKQERRDEARDGEGHGAA